MNEFMKLIGKNGGSVIVNVEDICAIDTEMQQVGNEAPKEVGAKIILRNNQAYLVKNSVDAIFEGIQTLNKHRLPPLPIHKPIRKK